MREGLPETARPGWADRRRASSEMQLDTLLERYPELNQYVTAPDMAHAAQIMQFLPYLLAANPQIGDELNRAYETKPDHISMIVVPDKPLVIARTSWGMQALAPILSCTKTAIGELHTGMRRMVRNSYDLVYSDQTEEALVNLSWKLGASAQKEKSKLALLSYDRTQIHPTDYIALAASGMLFNEVYRAPVKFK